MKKTQTHSHAKAHFKVSMAPSKAPSVTKNANGALVPVEYAHNLQVADRAAARAMRSSRRMR